MDRWMFFWFQVWYHEQNRFQLILHQLLITTEVGFGEIVVLMSLTRASV